MWSGYRTSHACLGSDVRPLGDTPNVTVDTWSARDLPVLKAVVELYEETGRGPRVTAVQERTGFDRGTVQRALRALYTEPYFSKSSGSWSVGMIVVGTPTGDALRAVGQWPSPEAQLDRLIAAIESAADDESREDDERGRFRQLAASLRGAAYQIAIGALGGAGGNLMTS